MTGKKRDEMVPSGKADAGRTTDEEWKEQDAYLDEALRETMPASDPISPGHVHHDPKAPVKKG
jgi:hypothetical protein